MNRKKWHFVIMITTLSLMSFVVRSSEKQAISGYDPTFVKIISNAYKGINYCSIRMNRSGEKVKAKYFANQLNGDDVLTRYNKWRSQRQVIVACAGTYYAGDGNPVGLCVDNGTIINYNYESKMDGLIIVYATGGIVAVNSKESTVNVVDKGRSISYDIKDEYQKNLFLSWAQNQSATIFQTHLLAKDNKCLVAPNSSTTARERRFLVVSRGIDNNLYHTIIYTQDQVTLRNFTLGIMEYMKNAHQMKEVSFIINLDTGAQDWIQTYESNGNLKPFAAGSCLRSENYVRNILAYSFE